MTKQQHAAAKARASDRNNIEACFRRDLPDALAEIADDKAALRRVAYLLKSIPECSDNDCMGCGHEAGEALKITQERIAGWEAPAGETEGELDELQM